MFHFRRPGEIFAALSGLILVLGLAHAAPADDQVPFKGRADVVVTNVEPIDDQYLRLTAVGTGWATHLGLFSRKESVVLNRANCTVEGTVPFIAANGDRLFADAQGVGDHGHR